MRRIVAAVAADQNEAGPRVVLDKLARLVG